MRCVPHLFFRKRADHYPDRAIPPARMRRVQITALFLVSTVHSLDERAVELMLGNVHVRLYGPHALFIMCTGG